MLRSRLEAVLFDPPLLLLPFLIFLSIIYRGISSLHRGLYESGILTSKRLPRPSVSVGNLTAGGGGKTPMTMWLAEKLMASGVRVAVLTRGYGRMGGGARLVEPGDDWRAVGDEPSLMASRITGLTVAVSKNRCEAAALVMAKTDVDLFLLDDGFQHYALERDLDIIAVDGWRRFGNKRMLPAGILREPLSRLKDADFIVVTRVPDRDPEFELFLNSYSAARVLWADYRPAALSPVGSPDTGDAKMTRPEGGMVAFCGIAGPEGFRETLARAGIQILDLMVFPDHHPFSASDVDRIVETASRRQAVGLVTTEKDAVRWPHRALPLPVYSLPVQPEIQGAEDLVDRVLGMMVKVREPV